jgi:hypothetical protein
MKRLNPEELGQIRKLVEQSITPQEIADRMGIAVSTVHYYKGLWKKDGLRLPQVHRGAPFKKSAGSRIFELIQDKTVTPEPAPVSKPVISPLKDVSEFQIGNCSIRIRGAKAINIDQNRIVIDY